MTGVWPEGFERISTPGVYDMPAELYHLDPVEGGSLSSSGARKLLPPSCPALFDHERKNPPATTAEFEFGHAAHQLVLGAGPELVVIEADNWRTKKAKDERKSAHADGAVALLARDYEQVQAMAAALREHPIAGKIFQPDRGRPEQSLIWQDGPTGVWRRARPDWLPHRTDGRLIISDYKTARDVDPDGIQRAVHQHGYQCQAAWYLDGARELGLAEDPGFVFIFQAKEPPYLVTPVELGATALYIGHDLNRRALDLYAECTASGRWPGYSDDEIELISLPGWFENRYLQEIS